MKQITLAILLIATCTFFLACKGRVYTIPSGAMAETLPAGSHVYITNSKVFKNNDIAVFNYFGDDYGKPVGDDYTTFEKSWQKWIKRIIASSGDKLEIKNGDVYLNDELLPFPPEGLMDYSIRSGVPVDDFPERNENPSLFTRENGMYEYVVQLTTKEAADYSRRKPAIISVIKRIDTTIHPQLARPCSNCAWSIDNYGPVKIPSVGETIQVDESNFLFYSHIPGIQKGSFTIKEKLYFVMGDNRHASMDSRFFGLISHSSMIGIAK